MNHALAVTRCYQCGKCTAGCPQAERMDLAPTQILRLVQLGQTLKAASSQAIWKCVSCLTCSTRCPQEVDCAAVMDALRQMAVAQRVAEPAQQRTLIFQQAFLQNIRRYGRLHELELIGVFKSKTFLAGPSLAFLFQDATLAPQLQARGKLHLAGESVQDRSIVQRIFARCGE